jgi:hypothetical protein
MLWGAVDCRRLRTACPSATSLVAQLKEVHSLASASGVREARLLDSKASPGVANVTRPCVWFLYSALPARESDLTRSPTFFVLTRRSPMYPGVPRELPSERRRDDLRKSQ